MKTHFSICKDNDCEGFYLEISVIYDLFDFYVNEENIHNDEIYQTS